MKDNKSIIIIALVAFTAIAIAVIAVLYFSGAFNALAIPAKKCQVGGCSGELCYDANDSKASSFSTCIWSDQFACYKLSKCEVQQNGACGWTANTEFNQCLIDKSSAPIIP